MDSAFASPDALECHRLSGAWEQPLAVFFKTLQASGVASYFHPHPFTAEAAQQLAQYKGLDLYYVLVRGEEVLGYGMLRGWDEGYDVPSLGIALHPAARGVGLGKAFMHFLHVAARLKGARKIRLKVYPDNATAVKLYESLGYDLQTKEAGQLVGTLAL